MQCHSYISGSSLKRRQLRRVCVCWGGGGVGRNGSWGEGGAEREVNVEEIERKGGKKQNGT